MFRTTIVGTIALSLLGCAADVPEEEQDTTASEIASGNGDRLGLTAATPAGLPKELKVTIAPAKCPLVTDCNERTMDRMAQQALVFGPDIVVLTELFYEGSFTKFKKAFDARTGGNWYFARGPVGSGAIGATGGVVIFSKYPFSRKVEKEYEDCSNPDCHTAKGIVVTTLRLGRDELGAAVTLDVGGTHMQSKTILGNFTKTQWNQIDEQRQFLSAAEVWGTTGFGARNAPLKMLVGDFNFSSTGPEYFANGIFNTQGAVRDAKANWRKLVDNVLQPNALAAGRLLCGDVRDVDQARACGEKRSITYDADGGDIIKQLYTPTGDTASAKGVTRTYLAPVRMQHTVLDWTKYVPEQPQWRGILGGAPRAPYKVGDRVDNGRVKAVYSPGGGLGGTGSWRVIIEPDLNPDQARQLESDHPTQQITYRLWNRLEGTASTQRRNPGDPPPPPHEEG